MTKIDFTIGLLFYGLKKPQTPYDRSVLVPVWILGVSDIYLNFNTKHVYKVIKKSQYDYFDPFYKYILNLKFFHGQLTTSPDTVFGHFDHEVMNEIG